jgi:hypothetical protein
MTYLFIFAHQKPNVFLGDLQIAGKESISLFGEEFSRIAQNLCFDWIVDGYENITGMDFNFSGNESFWLENEKSLLKCIFDFDLPNARFWFGNQRTGKIKLCGDWEDYYFRSKNGGLLICASTHMLNENELQLLRNYIPILQKDIRR